MGAKDGGGNVASGMDERGGSVGSVGIGHGGSVGNGHRGRVGNGHGGGDGMGLGDSLDGVGAGLMDNGLVDGLVGPHGSGDGDLGVDRDILEDGLGSMVGPHNGGRLVGGNGSGDMSVDGLRDGVGDGGDLGGDAGESMRLGGGVGKVAAQSVVLDGRRIVGGGTDQGGGAGHGGGHSDGAGAGESNQSGEEQELVHDGCLLTLRIPSNPRTLR